MIPQKYTCDGENINPPLQITDVPSSAQSLVLIVDDPDAPSGDWVHWLVWNINPETKLITENESPKEAIQGTNDFGKQNYGGPCPPSGTHRYQFKIYALDTILNLSSSSRKKDLETAMENHILDKGILIGLYQRI
ncbi:YbhB/YbcL family Raf kinase inhibitor-like protein [Patescibacteria group bacterium]|nr:YbhB/YbcL family Raf kinase inhibitor-like protein [Patescibacteria group bacterium]